MPLDDLCLPIFLFLHIKIRLIDLNKHSSFRMEPNETALNVLIIIALFLLGFLCHLITKIYFPMAITGRENDEDLPIEDVDLFIVALIVFCVFLCRCFTQNV